MGNEKKSGEKKGFFARLLESLDKKMEEKANSSCGCGCSSKNAEAKDKKCC